MRNSTVKMTKLQIKVKPYMGIFAVKNVCDKKNLQSAESVLSQICTKNIKEIKIMKKFAALFLVFLCLFLTSCSTWEKEERPAREIYFADCNSDMPLRSLLDDYNDYYMHQQSAGFCITDWNSMQGIQDSHLYHPFHHGVGKNVGKGVELLDPASVYDIAVFDTTSNAIEAFSNREEWLESHPEENHYIYLCGRVIFELPRFLSFEDAAIYKERFHKIINKRWDLCEGKNNVSVLAETEPIDIVEMASKKLEKIASSVSSEKQRKEKIKYLSDCIQAINDCWDDQYSTSVTYAKITLTLMRAEMLIS